MSQFSYNGIDLELVGTQSYNKQMVYDESGLDYLWTEVTLDLECVYNAAATSSKGAHPATTDAAIRHALSQPKGELIYGDELATNLHVAAGGSVDVNNGPKPEVISVRKVNGTQTWMVGYRIKTWINECPDGADQPILSNRWTQTIQVDEMKMSTILTEGRTVFRADVLQVLGSTPDDYRANIIPGCPSWFKRTDVRFQISPQRNVAIWSTVDREQYYSLGDRTDPAMPAKKYGVEKFTADYTMSSTTLGGPENAAAGPGPYVQARLAGSVWGNRESARSGLTLFALALVAEKFKLNANIAQGRARIIQASINQALHERRVDYEFIGILNPAGVNKQGAGVLNTEQLFANDTSDLIPDTGKNPQMFADNTAGTYKGHVLSQVLLASCESPTKLTVAGSSDDGYDWYLEDAVPQVYQSISDDIPTYESQYSQEQTESDPYTHYKIDTRYSTDYHTIQAPVASKPNSYSSGTDPNQRQAAEILFMAPPTSYKIVDWTAERINLLPDIPDPDVTDGNYTILTAHATPAARELMQDGQSYIYRVSGQYVYAATVYEGAGDNLFMGSTPIDNGETAFITDDNWVNGLIDGGA